MWQLMREQPEVAQVRAQTSAALATLERASAQLQQLPHELAGPSFDGAHAPVSALEMPASQAASMSTVAPIGALDAQATLARMQLQAQNGYAASGAKHSEDARLAAEGGLEAMQGLNVSDEAVAHNAQRSDRHSMQ